MKIVKKTLSKEIAETLTTKGSRLAHLYGLPKTHKQALSNRPVLSATETYNFKLAKWLDSKLKMISTNEHSINDVFNFSDDIRQMNHDQNGILASYDVSSLFTSIPLDETIKIIVS